MAMTLPKTVYSQSLSINRVQRDSIVSKILRGNKAQEQVIVLREQISKRDNVIEMQDSVIKKQKESYDLQDLILKNKENQINNLNQSIKNEVKIGKSKSRRGFFKGLGVGSIVTLILIIFLN